MLPSSVRRVASAAAQQSPLISTLAAGASRPIATYTLASRPIKHQRRCSSSKPSSSDNGPKDLPAGQSVPASTQSAKSSGEKRKRKSKSSQASAQKLPSVPSTQHLPLESAPFPSTALALSSFFSQHRPISITHSLPKTISDDAFASIFAPRTKAQKSSEVMSTLSKAVDELEAPFSNLGLGAAQQADGAELGEDNVHKIELKHPDGTESSLYVQLNAMAGQFLPFQPPPAPQADAAETGGAAALAAAAAEAAEEDVDREHHRVYKAILTIEEQTDAHGQIKIVAHSPQLIEEPAPPRTFLERMAVRHLRFEDALRWRERQMEREREDGGGPGMLAISVRRQKKLKMKKKKYKKLMKRTRNLRRKLMK
ncbi:uncharacterized protein E0L32_009512 [Thyridium curvatum]|uniref:Small ribosomal subunit protein mS38 n=1 Tax=Thyridium curvatum TaxID=1093900 RepID=A0A507AYJ1_9PEZI|nr:uncharacterized protein E0L32_009512 [Thyridium curvatum]TPX09320.1 hypothetical protein E0L32_009512 [Thyridium curvatum]